MDVQEGTCAREAGMLMEEVAAVLALDPLRHRMWELRAAVW